MNLYWTLNAPLFFPNKRSHENIKTNWQAYLVVEVKVGVHLDGLPAAHTVLVHAAQQVRVVADVPGAVKVRRLYVTV